MSSRLLKIIKTGIQKLAGRLPHKLPVGGTEFDKFFDSIVETYDLPNLPSYKHAVATMIMHLGPLQHRVSKHYFYASIRKSMANQVAYDKIQEIKDAERAKAEPEPEQKSA